MKGNEFDASIHLPAGLTPRGDDHAGDPAHCVVANAIRDKYPWAKSVKVGKKTITVYDYRCKHNPEGIRGGCDKCVGKGHIYKTPDDTSDCMTAFDETEDCVFPEIALKVARDKVAAQDRQQKRQAMADYRERIEAGTHKPTERSNQSLRSADRRRRSS